MKSLNNVVIEFLLLLCIFFASAAFGCGPLQPGQERILRFNVDGFTLALPMVYTENLPRSTFPSVQRGAMQAQAFVLNLIMSAVNEVLEQQGRNAGLSFEVISLILDQLTVNVTYTPLNCFSVSTIAQEQVRMDNMNNCLVVSDTVNSICTMMTMANCIMPANIQAVPQQSRTISGTLRIRNVIMAGWSNQMWQTILNRVLQVLSSGPFRMNFQGASVNIA